MSLEKKIYREWAFTGNESERPDIIIQPMQSLRITQICRSWSLP